MVDLPAKTPKIFKVAPSVLMMLEPMLMALGQKSFPLT